jgi:hypothetical protein
MEDPSVEAVAVFDQRLCSSAVVPLELPHQACIDQTLEEYYDLLEGHFTGLIFHNIVYHIRFSLRLSYSLSFALSTFIFEWSVLDFGYTSGIFPT